MNIFSIMQNMRGPSRFALRNIMKNVSTPPNNQPQILQINKYMLLRGELFVLNAENEKTACFPLAICQNSGTIYLALKANEC